MGVLDQHIANLGYLAQQKLALKLVNVENPIDTEKTKDNTTHLSKLDLLLINARWFVILTHPKNMLAISTNINQPSQARPKPMNG